MYQHRHSIRVRYAETDQMSYVYYGNYALYYEVGRVETMRSLGLSYALLENEVGVMMPVMKMDIEFLRPAFYDQLLTVVTSIPSLPEKEILFQSEIYNESNKIVNRGNVLLCFIDKSTKKRITAPDILLDKLREYYE
ncbi:MAG: acyl-CoA thioesterase [Saprospiraceae bacterium]|nr:acyl-CoA thioesterase [Saprospiraceae bacterium]